MISQIMRLVNSTDNLFLSPPQQKELLDYAKSLKRRFTVARLVEEAEPKILDAALLTVQNAHPEIGDWVENGWETHGTDLRFALRTIVRGMLVDDPEYAGQSAVQSLANELKFLEFPPTVARGLFEGLQTACSEILPLDASEILSPFFVQAIAEADTATAA